MTATETSSSGRRLQFRFFSLDDRETEEHRMGMCRKLVQVQLQCVFICSSESLTVLVCVYRYVLIRCTLSEKSARLFFALLRKIVRNSVPVTLDLAQTASRIIRSICSLLARSQRETRRSES